MKRPIIDLSSDSDDASPAAALVPRAPLAEVGPSPARPRKCKSYQHPSTSTRSGWIALGCWSELFLEGDPYPSDEEVSSSEGVGGGASPASGAMGTGSGGLAGSIEVGRPIVAGPYANVFPPHVRFWIDSIGERMWEAEEFVRAYSDRVRWHLAPPGSNIVDACIAHINDILGQQFVREYYIGLTARLPQRWVGERRPLVGRRPMRGHNVRFQEMVIVGVSADAGEIGDAEEAVIAQFRRFGRSGQIENHNGDFRCANRSPGREGARGGEPPHCLYVCWSWNPRS